MGDKHFRVPMGDGAFACVDIWGSGDYVIDTARGQINFEWSDQFGPMPVNKKGAERNLSHRHPFWRAASLWNLQGQRLDGNKAIWHEPKKPVLQHLGGRHYRIIEHGEKGHDW